MTSVPPPFQHPGPPPPRPEVPEGVHVPDPAGPDAPPPLGVPVWAPFAALLGTFVAVLFLGVLVQSSWASAAASSTPTARG